MSQANSVVPASEWLKSLTDQQSRALAHQIGIAGSVTFPIDKLRERLGDRKNMRLVKRIYEEHYDVQR